jgi:hypothetical protein
MSNPVATTAEIRAWAQAAGLDVAERGRLRPEVVAAFHAAQSPATTPAAKPVKAAKPAKLAKAVQPAKPTKAARPLKAASTPVPAAHAPVVTAPEVTAPEVTAPVTADAPAVAVVDPLLGRLESALSALTARVDKLEAAAAASVSAAPRRRFGRKG